MAYNYETQWDSPNFTTAADTRKVWGVDRNLQHIDIHWWDDPAKNPTYEGTIATLCNPNRGASAHYVATGTGRRVACLVSPDNNSWATNQDNPYSISIECDPRCRDEDYDVVAELISDIRSAYGQGLTLHGHREFVATTCPGNWDLARLDALSKTKVSHDAWGDVSNIEIPKPPIVTPPVVTPEPPVATKPTKPVIVPPIEKPIVTEPVKKSWIKRLLELIIELLNKIMEK